MFISPKLFATAIVAFIAMSATAPRLAAQQTDPGANRTAFAKDVLSVVLEKSYHVDNYDDLKRRDGWSSKLETRLKEVRYATVPSYSVEKSPFGSYCAGVTAQLFCAAYLKVLAETSDPVSKIEDVQKLKWLAKEPEEFVKFGQDWYGRMDLYTSAVDRAHARLGAPGALESVGIGTKPATIVSKPATGDAANNEFGRLEKFFDAIKAQRDNVCFLQIWFPLSEQREAGHSAIYIAHCPLDTKRNEGRGIRVFYWSSQRDNFKLSDADMVTLKAWDHAKIAELLYAKALEPNASAVGIGISYADLLAELPSNPNSRQASELTWGCLEGKPFPAPK